MLNKKLLGSVSSPPSDDNFENVSLLLSGDGTNGAQNNTFLDSSTNNFTITRNGNTTQGSFSPYGSNWSNHFNGSNAWLTTASNAAFAFGTGDFTMEAWIFPTASQTDNWIIGLANNCWLRIGSAGKLEFYDSVGAAGTLSASAVSLNVWSHVAAVRSGTTLTLYINGSSVATSTVSSNYSTSVACTIGNQSGQARYWNGYISNVRVVKGTAVYTSAFTPSTTPLTAITNTSLLTCQSNRFIDNSTNNFTLTVNGSPSVQRFSPFNPTAPYSTSVIGGSGYFDGSGDYLSLTGATAIGTSNYTVEYWIYPTSTELLQGVFVTSLSAVTGNLRTGIYNGKVYVDIYDGSGSVDTGSAVPLNAWSHIAITKSGSSYTSYLNGAVNTTWTDSTTITGTAWVTGRLQSDGYDFKGYVSNLRVVVGSVVYTAAFTPPTAPVTAITNTQLLENMINAGIPDLAMQNNLETVGNAQVSTSVVKYGTGSLAFDGSGDVLSTVFKPQFNFSGDFTIECWLYMNSLASTGTVFSQNSGSTFFILHTSVGGSNSLDLYIDTLGGAPAIQSSSLSTGVWYHVALTRSGSSFKLFLNGTQTGSTYTNSGNPTPSSNPSFFIGNNNASNGAPLNGYIDDLRVTTGLARYTTTFTPPASALPSF